MLELVEDAAATGSRVHFLPQGTAITVRELWSMSSVAARWLGNEVGRDEPVGMLMDSSAESIAAFLAGCRGGRRVVSLPGPPRGSPLGAYRRFVEEACAMSGVGVVLVPESFLRFLPDLAIDVRSFEGTQVAGPSTRYVVDDHHGSELVQFTSGSTSDPKGVILSIDQVTANINALLEQLQPRPGDVACSWLPLSHDMGLIGMTLAVICAGSPRWAGGGDLVLIRPEWFLRRPESWLEACSSFRATVTAAPDFGFRQAMRRGPTRGVADLSTLRVCITGAEPVRAPTLRDFRETFASAGFNERAFCPAYGLAEAGLAVTLTEPDDMWASLVLDEEGLGNDRVMPSATGRELVAAGGPLNGYAVIAGDRPGAVGRVRIKGPSLLDRYLQRGPANHFKAGEWFETNDLGFVHNDQLYVTGRADDVVLIAGRNIYLSDVDEASCGTGIVERGRAVAIASQEGFDLVAEGAGLDAAAQATRLRGAVVATIGLSPTNVFIVRRGALPKTPSGKPRRAELRRKLESQDGVVIHHASFGT